MSSQLTHRPALRSNQDFVLGTQESYAPHRSRKNLLNGLKWAVLIAVIVVALTVKLPYNPSPDSMHPHTHIHHTPTANSVDPHERPVTRRDNVASLSSSVLESQNVKMIRACPDPGHSMMGQNTRVAVETQERDIPQLQTQKEEKLVGGGPKHTVAYNHPNPDSEFLRRGSMNWDPTAACD
eukprot:5279018-Pyramimonas_sp.AAC.1